MNRSQARRALFNIVFGVDFETWIGLEECISDFGRREIVLHYFQQGGRRTTHHKNTMKLEYCAISQRWLLDIPSFASPKDHAHLLNTIGFHLLWNFLPPEVRYAPVDARLSLPWTQPCDTATLRTRNQFWESVINAHACSNKVSGIITGKLQDPLQKQANIPRPFVHYPLDHRLWPEISAATIEACTTSDQNAPGDCFHQWNSSIITCGIDPDGHPVQSATCDLCGKSAYEHTTSHSLKQISCVTKRGCNASCDRCPLPQIAPIEEGGAKRA